jgi:hypothetical protein
MLLSQDSIFRKIPLRLKPEQVYAFDAIRYSIDIADISYTRLLESLYSVSFQEDQAGYSFPYIFGDSWTMINNLTIFNTILTQYFKIDHLDPLLFPLTNLKTLRNSNQHISERFEIANNPYQFPVFGKLTWLAQNMETMGAVYMSLYSGVFTSKEKSGIEFICSIPDDSKPIYNVCLTGVIQVDKKKMEEKAICLTDLYKDVSVIISELENQLSSQIQPDELSKTHNADLLVRACLKRD